MDVLRSRATELGASSFTVVSELTELDTIPLGASDAPHDALDSDSVRRTGRRASKNERITRRCSRTSIPRLAIAPRCLLRRCPPLADRFFEIPSLRSPFSVTTLAGDDRRTEEYSLAGKMSDRCRYRIKLAEMVLGRSAHGRKYRLLRRLVPHRSARFVFVGPSI